MIDPRKYRQTGQAIAAYLVGGSAALLAKPFDWRALVAAMIAVTVALLTNPRLVGGLDNAMPAAGSSAVKPVIRDSSTGHATPTILLLLAFVTLAICAGLSVAYAADIVQPVQTNAPSASTTTTDPVTVAGNWTWGPSVAAAIVAVNLTDGSYTAGVNAIPLGACLGLTYKPFDIGADGCFNVQLANKNTPNRYFPSLMVHIKKYFQGGVGYLLEQDTAPGGGLIKQWLLLGGGRLGFAGG
jgi:hypothetical protein